MEFNQNQIKGFIFDVDGTLIDSIPVWRSIDEVFFTSIGQSFNHEIREIIKSQTFEQSAAFVVAHYQLEQSPQDVKNQWMTLVKDKYINDVPLKNGVKEILEILKANNLKVMIASSGEKELIQGALKKHNIMHFFDGIITASELGTTKLEPTIYEYCASAMNLAPHEIIVCEDLGVAMETANKAGFNVVAMHDGESIHEMEQIKAYAHAYVHDFRELVR